MNLTQALERANALSLPGMLMDDESRTAERRLNEEALGVMLAAWRDAPAGKEGFPFAAARDLADRNRELCDDFGVERLRRDETDKSLQRHLSDQDLVRSVAHLQHRRESAVRREAGPANADLGAAYVGAPVSGVVCGVDIETSDLYPDRGYIINVGVQLMELSPDARPTASFSAYCGIPDLYREKGVPLAEIHRISWGDLDGETPFRENRDLQKALLATFTKVPFMAHNAAYEDSWFMLHLDGYAEARKAGKIVPVDTRDICRRIDPDVKLLPRESHPATLENWARRRGVLAPHESERHLGLEDVDLMLRTVQAEFSERNMFA